MTLVPTSPSTHLRNGRLNHITAGRTVAHLVGNTPLIALPGLSAELPPGVELYAKAEWYNPSGSIKDRAALNIILHAEEQGLLGGGQILLDSTSGNMGIAYATLGIARGHRVALVVPENASPERMHILKHHGVELILSDGLEGSDGAILKVREVHAQNPGRYFYANQYNNPANWQAHYEGTGVEIWQQTGGRVTHFVAGLGTSGTLTGTGRRLKEENPAVELVAFQPDSPFHGLEGLKHIATSIAPGIYDADLPDRQLGIRTEDAQAMCRRVAREEGILIGVSAGAALVAAMQVARGLEDGGVVVTVLPDNGYKYLTDAFWQVED